MNPLIVKLDDVIHEIKERGWCHKKLSHFVVFLEEDEAIYVFRGDKVINNPEELIERFKKAHSEFD